MIIVLSKAYTGSSWLLSESLAFFKLMDPGSSIRIARLEDCDMPFHLEKLPCADFRGIDLDVLLGDRKHPSYPENWKKFCEGTRELVSNISKDPQAFVIMKFNDDKLDSIYKNAIAPALQEGGYKPVRIDKFPIDGSITTETLQQIGKSEIVLADLTGGRTNCYYETGYAHALGRDVILSIQKRAAKHFSLRVHRFIEWKEAEDFKRQIKDRPEEIHKQKNFLIEEGAEAEASQPPV